MSVTAMRLTETQHKKLAQWEAIMADVYMYNKGLQDQGSQENRITTLSHR